ncbi:MAG: N-acetylmuramoyl-L-alanine amidase [Variovorax sp.]|nr:N-acetylmuramoyl-L-alanine amidase [Variovorax sp.]
MSLYISKDGHVDAERVKVKIFPNIERGEMKVVNGIVLHQTDAPTAQSTFNSYTGKKPDGAHFLIDKDGTIYQTASLNRRTDHAGKLKSRCLATHTCTDAEFKTVQQMRNRYTDLSQREYAKSFPSRYPANTDSIGIEIVGDAVGPKGQEVFESVNDAQNASLKWLVRELADTLNVSMREVYRHPEVSYKNLTEASTAKW